MSSLHSRFRIGVVFGEGSKLPMLTNADANAFRTIPRPSPPPRGDVVALDVPVAPPPPPPPNCAVDPLLTDPNSPNEWQRLCPFGVRRPPRGPAAAACGLRHL